MRKINKELKIIIIALILIIISYLVWINFSGTYILDTIQ